MKIQQSAYLILFILIVNTFQMFSQITINDSLTREEFPFVVGNIGFATDSVDIVVGDVPRGEVSTFSIELYNFGNEPVRFTSGKSNRFVTLSYEPELLLPLQQGTMTVDFNADIDLMLGEFDTEISITSDDKKNPSKFLYMLMNIVENTGGKNDNSLDTVPHIVFDHYNYYYGHLVHGGKEYHTYLISNAGSEPLTILDIEVPKGITVIDRPVQPLLSREESILRIRINTKGRIGIQHQTVLVHSNDPANPLIILGIHGSVKVYPEHKKTSDQCNEHRQRF